MSPRTPLLCLAVALAACDPGPASDDKAVVRDTLAALSGSSAQLGMYDGLLGQVSLAGISLALAPKQVISQVKAGLADNLLDPKCHTLASDDATYLELHFKKCRYRGVYVDGTLRLELTAEAGTCDGAPCVVATRYTTTLTDYTIGKSQISAATSTLRIPEDHGEPRSVAAVVDLVDADDRDLHLEHELTWTRSAGCVTAELGAEFTIDDREISVGATGVQVCGDDCPRAGDVQIAWSTGKTLAWSYTGDPEVTVHGPRGRTFTLTQTCGEP